jgi:hypothetical protein
MTSIGVTSHVQTSSVPVVDHEIVNYRRPMTLDLDDVVWAVRSLGDAFSLSGCARKLGVEVVDLGYATSADLMQATVDHVIDRALNRQPSGSQADVAAMLWSITETFLVAPELGRLASTLQWETPSGSRLIERLGGQRAEVDLLLGLMTAWWEPMIDPNTMVSDPATGRPVDLTRVLAQHHSAIGRFDGRHFKEADDELRLWCLHAAVEALLVRS